MPSEFDNRVKLSAEPKPRVCEAGEDGISEVVAVLDSFVLPRVVGAFAGVFLSIAPPFKIVRS